MDPTAAILDQTTKEDDRRVPMVNSSGWIVCKTGSSIYMVPVIWWDEIDYMQHSIADIMSRVTTRPIEDNHI